MIKICDVLSINGQMVSAFKKQYKSDIASNFAHSLSGVNLFLEDVVTEPKEIDPIILAEMGKGVSHFDLPVLFSGMAENQMCMVVSIAEKRRWPSYRLMVGWATIHGLSEQADGCNEWHCHAFLITPEKTIIEPTPLKRDVYYGVELSDWSIDQIEAKIRKMKNADYNTSSGVIKNTNVKRDINLWDCQIIRC